ncbi:MAG: PspC domain-containing protein [Pseudomonadota bacterium]
MNISEEIKRLHELHQAGALSAEEFEQAKAKLLNASVDLNKPSSSGGGDFATEIGRLRRSRNDRWLGGVCGGLGKVSGIDSWIWRMIFAVCVFLYGFGGLLYLLLWIFVPEE